MSPVISNRGKKIAPGLWAFTPTFVYDNISVKPGGCTLQQEITDLETSVEILLRHVTFCDAEANVGNHRHRIRVERSENRLNLKRAEAHDPLYIVLSNERDGTIGRGDRVLVTAIPTPTYTHITIEDRQYCITHGWNR